MNIDEYNASLEKQDGQAQDTDTDDNVQDDMDRIFDFGDDEDDSDFSSIDEKLNEDSEDEEESQEKEEVEETEEQSEELSKDDSEQEESEKKVQTPEENARFAQMRREQQAREMFEKQRQQTPEYQVAKMLADRYGLSIEQMQQQLQESALQEQAKQQNVPIEFLRRQQEQEQRIQAQQQQLQLLQFQTWEKRIQSEKAQIKQDYPYLEDADIEQAVQHLFDIRNTDLPLEQAVYAVHGKKIADAIKEQARQDALAEIGGRTKSPLVPQGGKSDPNNTLTAEERYVAKQMGISEKDYLKYKRSN